MNPIRDNDDLINNLARLVIDQTKCAPAQAFDALINNNGDVVSAIIEINNRNG